MTSPAPALRYTERTPTPGLPNPMQAVVRLQGKIIQVRDVEAGAGVGYGFTWVAREPSRIATVSVGYADGYLRSLSNSGPPALDGIELPVAGRVSMDTITIDASALPEGALQAGSMVDLLSPEHGVGRGSGTCGDDRLRDSD